MLKGFWQFGVKQNDVTRHLYKPEPYRSKEVYK
jgi:hypothetical protein